MTDTTTTTLSHMGAAPVSAGTACTISYAATLNVAFSCNVAAIFVPSTGGSI